MHDDKTLTSNFCIDMPQDDLSTGRNMLPTYKGNSFKLQQTCVKSDWISLVCLVINIMRWLP